MLFAEYKTFDSMDTLGDRIRMHEREAVIRALRECSWIQAQAARRLGISKRMIGYRIKKYTIKRRKQ